MDTPLLSICIATYNRAQYIGETLNSIIPQLEDDVELLIVDGASTDETKEIVEEFTRKNAHIRYVCLFAKGGVDKDYDKSVELARGEFCWFFTDDDLLKPGAVNAVKSAIAGGHDLTIVNAEVRDNKLSVILEHRRINIFKNRIYDPHDVDRFFVDTVNYISFIGAVVIRRSVWLSRKREPYFGTEFIHIGVIFQKILATPIFVIAEPYIAIRWGNAQWAPRGFDIWMFKWPKLIQSFDDISPEAKQKIIGTESWKNFKNFIFYRRTGSYDVQVYYRYFLTVTAGVGWKFLGWVIAIFPMKIMAPLYDFLRKLYRGVVKK